MTDDPRDKRDLPDPNTFKGGDIPSDLIDPDLEKDMEKLFGDHTWGKKTKRSKFMRKFYYPMWMMFSKDFRTHRFYNLPKKERVKIVRKIANNIEHTERYLSYPLIGEVIGREKEINVLLDAVYYHILRNPVAKQRKKPPPKVFIIKAEPGTGKSFLVQAIMREAFERAVDEGFICTPIQLEGANVTSMFMGQYTQGIAQVFEMAAKVPSILYIDEAEQIFGKGSEQHTDSASKEYQMAESAMLQAIDRIIRRPVRTLILISTNKYESLREDVRRRGLLMDLDNPGLRRPDMIQITANLLKKVGADLDPEQVLEIIEQGIRGAGEGKIVPADLERAFDIANTVSEAPLRESFLKKLKDATSVEALPITLDSFKEASKEARAYKNQQITQSVKEAEQTIPPKTRYHDIGGLRGIKDEVIKEVNLSLHPDIAPEGWEPPRGYLFYGDPGTGKTLLASAIAGENKVPFYYVKGPSLYMGLVGETEKSVRNLFTQAKQKAPSIIFMDEIDAIGAHRGSIRGDAGVQQGALTTLLSQLDGMDKGSSSVVFIGSTNRKDQLDSALLERLDKQFQFRYPTNTDEKLDVIRAQWRPYKKFSDATPEEILKIFMKRTFSPRISADVIKEAARMAMLERVACSQLLKAMKEDDAEEQRKIRETVYLSEFKRIQERLVKPVEGAAPEFDLVSEYKKIAEKNPLTLSHILKAFDAKAITDEDREIAAIQEMHRSREPVVGKGYGLATESTGVKGMFLTVEAMIFPAAKPGEGAIKVYGNVGKGAIESAQLGGTFLRKFWKNMPNFDIVLHIISPQEGGEDIAISGPSAGQVMFWTMLSAIIREPFNPKVCMTGRIDLNGTVGMVGGIQPKKGTGKLDTARESQFELCLIPKLARDEIAKDFPSYLDQFTEVGCQIVGGTLWTDYEPYVFPNLTVAQVIEKLEKA